MKKTMAILGIVWYGMSLLAQGPVRKTEHSATLKTQFLQVKDEFNYGLVHRGLNLAGEYELASYLGENILRYEAGLGFGASYNQGLGMHWSLKPLDLFYGFRINDNPDMPITLGPYAAGYYTWQLYPELQSGQMFWLSSYEIGPQFEISIPLKKRVLHATLSTSVASLNSRPEYVTEQYYYSLTFSDFVTNPHTNMTFGSVNLFNHTDLRLELVQPGKGFSLAYEFEFMGYFDVPEYRSIAQSINLNWIIGYKKNN